MSGNFVPYQLRIGKGIDRRLLFQVILKCSDYINLDRTTYCSMPGPFAEDFKAVYNVLKVRSFVSIESSPDTVRRQQFNWEFDKANFVFRPSETFVSDLDTLDCESLIVWLDYTAPSDLGFQLREASEVLAKLKSGDIFRITLNANPDCLDTSGDNRTLEEKAPERRKRLLSRLGVELDLTEDSSGYSSKGFQKTLAAVFKHFANQALESSEHYFYPLLITTYQDGPHRMLTVTGAILSEAQWPVFLEKTGLQSMDCVNLDWDCDAIEIETPSLSDKERLFIDARADLEWTIERIVEDLGFKIAAGNSKKQLISVGKYVQFRNHIPYITRTAPGL